MKSLTYLVAACAMVVAAPVAAQARMSVAVDGTVGAANGKGGEFVDRDLDGMRLAVSARRLAPGHVGFYVEGNAEWLAVNSGHKAICVPGVRTQCQPFFPELVGTAALLGAMLQDSKQRIELRLGAGAGSYTAAGTRAGAIITSGDAAFFPVSHVGVVLGGRWIVMPDYRGDRLSMTPWMFGVRIR